jgi:hypothetical protein
MGDVLHDAGRGRKGYSDWRADALLNRWKSSAFDQSEPFFAAPFLSQPDPSRTCQDSLYHAGGARWRLARSKPLPIPVRKLFA